MIKKIKRKFFDLRFRYLKYRRIKIIVYQTPENSPHIEIGSYIIKCKGFSQAWDLFQLKHYSTFIQGDHIDWFEVI